MIASRLKELSFDARRLVGCAAAIGHSVNAALLQTALGLDAATFSRAAQEALRSQFLEELGTGSLAFRNGEVPEVAYESVPEDQRRTVHKAIARAMIGRSDPDNAAQLAHHWERAGDPESAAHYYLAAARKSAEQLAEREAERQYRAALRLFADGSDEETDTRHELVDYLLAIKHR